MCFILVGSAKDHGRNGCKLCNSKQFCEPQDYDYCCPCAWHLAEGERQTNAAEISVKRYALSLFGIAALLNNIALFRRAPEENVFVIFLQES